MTFDMGGLPLTIHALISIATELEESGSVTVINAGPSSGQSIAYMLGSHMASFEIGSRLAAIEKSMGINHGG